MPSVREQVIDAVVTKIQATFPQATVLRNSAKPEGIGLHGLVVVRDGDPGDPEITMSPLTYIYEHRIPVEIAVNPSRAEDAESTLDDMLVLLGRAVEADRTLGGLCDFVDTEAPATEAIEATGAVAARWGDAAVVAIYATSNPLT